MTKQKNNPHDNSAGFDDYALYYDLLYQDKDYKVEADYVKALLQRFHPETKTVLELGSGTGIHASLLAEKGLAVHGIERSQEMLTRSLALADQMTYGRDQLAFSQGDIRDIRLNKSFDAVIALFHVISYQTTNADVSATFKTARQHLKPGGIFIFDVWYGPAVLTERPEVRIKRMSDDHIEITRLAEPLLHPNENTVDVNYHVFVRNKQTQAVSELKEKHTMRYFFKPEIENIAAQSGLNLLHTEEWLTGKQIGTDTWGVCFILESHKK